MANLGYGGQYSTTSYGAQGGADGGGFMGGSQSGSQDSPGGQRHYAQETLRPVTIKQIIDAQQPHSDSSFKIDGTEVNQLAFVGQIHSISVQHTNIAYTVDDGTGIIEAKQWVDSDVDPESKPEAPKEGSFIRICGVLKSFNNKRMVNTKSVRPVTDFNEISYHFLEATAVHLYYTRGPPPNPNAVKEEENGMFVDNAGGDLNGGGVARKIASKVGPTARKVFELLQASEQNNEGLHVQHIAQRLNAPVNDVYKAGDELLAEGIIYTTVDDDTWALLAY